MLAGVTILENTAPSLETPKDIVLSKRTRIGRCTIKYMSGAIIKILCKSKEIKNCKICKENLLKRHSIQYEDDEIIEARQYERGNLVLPGDFSNFLISMSLSHLFYLIPRLRITPSVCEILCNILLKELSFCTINCPSHNLGQKLCKLITRCCLYWWSKSVNKILQGRDTKFSVFLSRTKNKTLIDPIKQHALKVFEKRLKYKNRK